MSFPGAVLLGLIMGYIVIPVLFSLAGVFADYPFWQTLLSYYRW